MSHTDYSGFFWHAVWPVLMVILVVISLGVISPPLPAGYDLVAQVNGPNGPVKAFPEAEGFGASSLGGRGPGGQTPQVIAVTNLNDSGSGSLRAAVEASGPRFVIFKVGGVIHQASALTITNPYIYIAGQTAPAPGITLARWGITVLGPSAHDVTIRYIRQRTYVTAADEGGATSLMDSLRIWADKVIIDHASLSWAADEIVDVGDYGSASTGNYTIQWSILSEGAASPTGQLGVGRATLINGGSANGSLHHNLIAHSSDRNPKVEKGNTYDIRNNVVYNWRLEGTAHFGLSGPIDLNFIGNTYIPGLDSNQGDPPFAGSFTMRIPKAGQVSSLPRIYLSGNRAPWRSSDSQNEWDVGVLLQDSQSNANSQLLSPINQTEPPASITDYSVGQEFSVPAVTTHSADQAKSLVLQQAGNNFPQRDVVDSELASEINGGMSQRHFGPHHGENRGLGTLPNPTETVFDWIVPTAATVDGLYPANLTPTLPTDTDGDQVPDNWEYHLGSNITTPDATSDFDNDGYLNIEEYLNGLMTITPPNPPPPAQSACGNNTVETGEVCDGTNLNNKTCATQGFGSGTLTCASNCQSFVTTQCAAAVVPITCGNGVVNTGEECDGSVPAGQTCQTRGFQSGTLVCSSNCVLSTAQCTAGATCGNGVINTGEQCDGNNLNNQTCVAQGFGSGTLTCGSNCQFVTTQCVIAPTCGNGVINTGEQCDGGNLNSRTCITQGFSRGTLSCNPNCTVNTSACSRSPSPSPAPSRPPTAPVCKEKWECTGWSRCGEPERQTRNCTDINRCGTAKNKPPILQTCEYVKPLIRLENFAALRTLWAITRLIFFNLGKLFLPWQL